MGETKRKILTIIQKVKITLAAVKEPITVNEVTQIGLWKKSLG